METGSIILAVVVAVVLGGLVIWRMGNKREDTHGVVYAIYYESENKPSLLLEPLISIEDIAKQKRVHFDVRVIRENSHE